MKMETNNNKHMIGKDNIRNPIYYQELGTLRNKRHRLTKKKIGMRM